MAFKGFFLAEMPQLHFCCYSEVYLLIRIRRAWCPLLPKPQLCFHSSNSHWTQPFTTNCLSPIISQYLFKCEQLFALSSSTSAILFYGLHTPTGIAATRRTSTPTLSLYPSSERLTLKQNGKPNVNSSNGLADMKILQKCAKSEVIKSHYYNT